MIVKTRNGQAFIYETTGKVPYGCDPPGVFKESTAQDAKALGVKWQLTLSKDSVAGSLPATVLATIYQTQYVSLSWVPTANSTAQASSSTLLALRLVCHNNGYHTNRHSIDRHWYECRQVCG